MYAQKLSFDYVHSVHHSRVQKGQSCDCINFVRVIDPACGSGSLFSKAAKILGKENVR